MELFTSKTPGLLETGKLWLEVQTRANMNSAGVQVKRGGGLPVRALHPPPHVPAGRRISLGGQVKNISYATRRGSLIGSRPSQCTFTTRKH